MNKYSNYQNYRNAVKAIAAHDFSRIRNYYFSNNIDEQRSNLVSKMWEYINLIELDGESCPPYEVDLGIEKEAILKSIWN